MFNNYQNLKHKVMSKPTSFQVAFILAAFIVAMENTAVKTNMLGKYDMSAFLILWYILWKLFHDKNKDK